MMIDIFLLEKDSNAYWAYFLLILGILVAGFIGLVLVKIRELGIVVCGATGGFFLYFFLNYLIFWRIYSTPSYVD
jgi:hypothetical protein